MSSVGEGIRLTIIAHDDAHLAALVLAEGWGEAAGKKAAVVRLARADLEKLGLGDNARVELAGPGGSVIVTARLEAAGEAGVGSMPLGLYSRSLAGYGPAPLTAAGRHIEVRALPAAGEVTPVSDLIMGRDRA